jgi:hypothetical protein
LDRELGWCVGGWTVRTPRRGGSSINLVEENHNALGSMLAANLTWIFLLQLPFSPHITIDYRCDNRRFWLSAHNFQVPTPNFSKPRTKTAKSDFLSRLTPQVFARLKSTIPNLKSYLPKMANSEKLGLGIDNTCRIVFLSLRMNKCFERVNERHFWNPGVFSYTMIPRLRPNLKLFFHRYIYSLCCLQSRTVGQS